MIDENENSSQNTNLRPAPNLPGSQSHNPRPSLAPTPVSAPAIFRVLPESMIKMGFKPEHLAMLNEIELKSVELVAKEYIQNRDGIEGALRAAKAAATNARSVRANFTRNESAMLAESAIFLELARSEAEVRGTPIETFVAIREAIKIARTSRQKFSLLLRLRNHEQALKERQ